MTRLPFALAATLLRCARSTKPVGIVFKGKGFYATDNRSPSGQQYSHKAEGDGGNGSKSSSESGKTEGASKEPTKASTTSTAE